MGPIKFLLILIKFFSFSFSQPIYEIPGVCRLPISPGNCENSNFNQIPNQFSNQIQIPNPDTLISGYPDTRYGFDYGTKQCLPFNFCGNGGNGNNFFSRQDCLETCLNTQLLKPGGNRVGAPCETNLDCGKGAWCLSRFCACMPDYAEIKVVKECYPRVNPGQSGCWYNEQCEIVFSGSKCSGGQCICPNGMRPTMSGTTAWNCAQIAESSGSGLVGDPCVVSRNCQGGMWCNRQQCECTPDYAPTVYRTCLIKYSPGKYGCVDNSQCAFFKAGSICEKGFCVCPEGTQTIVQAGGAVTCYEIKSNGK